MRSMERKVSAGLRSPRWCVFISGRGSNLAAVLEEPGVDVRLVVTSDQNAAGVSKSLRAGVPVFIAPKKESGGLDWLAIDVQLRARSIECIFLLGFMRIVSESFVETWSGKILNLHPSLLPKYPGLKSIERAMMANDEVGVTVHEVVAAVDAGKVVRARRSLEKGHASGISEIAVHIDEQRLVKEVAAVWRS